MNPQVERRRSAASGVTIVGISAGQSDFCVGFDSRQLYNNYVVKEQVRAISSL
ncbi:hypothetical protein [Mycolicibacterium chubuense]|uniref:hypothetical protein n=1 Tax=Mycolicibacterium chubuense TaxID=1800 RepID=UPI0002F2C111|nr:hypothetical protein [Mycolicibacterium chubuense]